MMSEPVPNSVSFNRKRCSSVNSTASCKRVCSELTGHSDYSQTSIPLHDDSNESHVPYCADKYGPTTSCSNHCITDGLSRDTNSCRLATEDLNINDLPVLILLKIFDFLSLGARQHSVALVCQYWLQLSRDPRLWRVLDMRGQPKITDEVLSAITGYSRAVTVLDISDCSHITDNGVTVVLQACPRLLKLRLARCTQLTNLAFQNIGVDQAGAFLKEIDISSCWSITDNVLLQISLTCVHLTRLIVNQCTKLTDEGVVAAARSLSNLQELSLDECSQLSDTCLHDIVAYCCHLQYFSCKCIHFSARAISQCSKLTELRMLDVTGVKSVNDQVVCSIIDGCKGLTNLYLSLCPNVSDVAVKYIAQYTKNLTTLHLVSCGITDEAIRSLARHCQLLQVLDVGYCSNLTDNSACEILASCRQLRYLGLMRCDSISTATVLSLVDKHPQVVFSTVYLEMKRLVDAAQAQGFLQGPFIAQ